MLQCCVEKKLEIRKVVTRFLDLCLMGLVFKYLLSNDCNWIIAVDCEVGFLKI